MKPSVLSWVASHSAAAVLGCVIAAVTVSRQVPARDPVAPVPKKASTSSHPAVSKSGSASTVLGFKQAWERLAATPLSTIERNMLKDRLAQEWRSHDPLGLLEFLGHKHSWPAACNRYDQSLWRPTFPSSAREDCSSSRDATVTILRATELAVAIRKSGRPWFWHSPKKTGVRHGSGP